MVILPLFLALISASMGKGLLVPEEIKIGDHSLGEEVTVEIDISNNSSKSITIKKIIASCGCIKISPKTCEIPPKGTGKVLVTVDSFGIEGKFSKNIIFISDSEASPLITKITGKFIAKDHNLTVFPRSLGLQEIKHDERIQQVFRVSRRGNVSIGELVIKVPEWCRYKILSERSSDKRFYFVVTVDRLSPSDNLKGNIIVGGKNIQEDFARVPLIVQTRPKIEVFPKKVMVCNRKKTYALKVFCDEDQLPQLSKYEFQSEGMELTSCEIISGDVPNLLVKVSRKADKTGFCDGKLILQFKDTQPIKINFVSL